VSVIRDSGGFVTQRVVATIVNIAADICQQGICTPGDLETAVTLGLGYPLGPLAMGDRYGPTNVLEVLFNMQTVYGDPRYRPSPWLRRRGAIGLSLMHEEELKIRHDRRTQEHQPGPDHGPDHQQPRIPQRAGARDLCGRHRGAERGGDSPDIRSVVITGEGATFCAGGNLQRLQANRQQPPEVQAQSIEGLHTWIEAIRTFPKPVIAAVEGAARARASRWRWPVT
jgi:hypothetical protein